MPQPASTPASTVPVPAAAILITCRCVTCDAGPGQQCRFVPAQSSLLGDLPFHDGRIIAAVNDRLISPATARELYLGICIAPPDAVSYAIAEAEATLFPAASGERAAAALACAPHARKRR